MHLQPIPCLGNCQSDLVSSGLEYHEKRRKEGPRPYGTYVIHEQEVETFMWTIYELASQNQVGT